MELIGVDGCRGGWVVARARELGRAPAFTVEPDFGAIARSAATDQAIVVVDIPIGLSSGLPNDDGSRACDREARKFLGPRRAVSVFSAPCRATLEAESYREACAIQARARGSGKGLSRQAYGILPKIRQVDLVMTRSLQNWVREAHPEVSFAALSGGGSSSYGLAHPKKRCRACRHSGETCPGEVDRLQLLHSYFPDFEPVAERAARQIGRRLRRHRRRRSLPRYCPSHRGRPSARAPPGRAKI